MASELGHPWLHSSSERRPFRLPCRSLLVVATSAIAGLTAAGPALASDEPPVTLPQVVVPDVPEIAPPDITIPEPPPVELLEPVVVTHVDAENIDVSIRVLSPGEDAAVAQESETTVVSPDPAVDITETAEAADPADGSPAEPSGALNTNVSIRVLSPGDRGEVAQDSMGEGEVGVEAGAGPPAPRADAAPASTSTPTGGSDPEQYQEDNSQYQSEDDSWNWQWMLSVDCAGNVESSSTETGKQESLIWSWDWYWEWCTEASESVTTSTASTSPPAAAKPAPKPTGASATSGATTAADPWSWDWTFTVCGETSMITTRSGAGTPLVWTWDWNWTWSCGSAADAESGAAAPPATVMPTVGAQPLSSGQADEDEDEAGDDIDRSLSLVDEPATEMLQSLSFPSFTVTDGRGGASTFAWPAMPEPPLELTVEIVIPPVVLPATTAPSITSPVAPFPAADVSAEPTFVPTAPPVVRPSPTTAPAPVPESTWRAPRPEGAAAGTYARPRAHHARPAKHADAKSRSSYRSPSPFLPFERRQSRQAAGSSNAGGFVPSALLFGVAALTGFVLLAAPGIGRRVRVARELSPRGLAQSPLDRPG
jgi:hypothetical protein